MSIPNNLNQLTGSWAGVKHLWLAPGEPERVSNATALVGREAQGRFLRITYSWNEKGPQEGMILLGWQESSGVLKAAWIDSWHNGDSLMLCTGQLSNDDQVLVQGSYPAPTGPDWGWQIAIKAESQNTFRILMDNITPDGTHAPAVEIALTRQPDQ